MNPTLLGQLVLLLIVFGSLLFAVWLHRSMMERQARRRWNDKLLSWYDGEPGDLVIRDLKLEARRRREAEGSITHRVACVDPDDGSVECVCGMFPLGSDGSDVA